MNINEEVESQTEELGDVLEKTAKAKLRQHFTMIDNEFLQKSEVSLEARGLLCYLMSLPKDWVIYTSKISKIFSIGEKKTRRIFSELIEHGYMKRVQSRVAGDFSSYKTYISDFPEFLEDLAEGQNDSPVDLAEGQNGLPIADGHFGRAPNDRLQINTTTNKDLNINITNKDMRAREVRRKTSKEFPDEFNYFFWKLYPKKVDVSKTIERFDKLLRQDYSLYKVIVEALEAQLHQRKLRIVKGLWNPDPKGPAAWLKDRRWEDEVILDQEKLDEERRSAKPASSSRHQHSLAITDALDQLKSTTRQTLIDGSIEGSFSLGPIKKIEAHVRG